MWCGEEYSRIYSRLVWTAEWMIVPLRCGVPKGGGRSEWFLDKHSLGQVVFSLPVGRCLIGS